MKNGTKKILRTLKEYFIFSTGERKGIIYLLILLFFIICAPLLYDFIIPPENTDIRISDLQGLDEEAAAATDTGWTSSGYTRSLVPFDPNSASDKELSELGFTAKNIKTIRNYVLKGGKFRRPEDLGKIYGIRPEFFGKVKPYIRIREPEKPVHQFSDTSKFTSKKKNNEPVELNTADSMQLVALYRIGPSLAHRIIEYRSKLGGFLKVEQLKELWKFDEDILYDLKDRIWVDAGKARIFDLNSVTIDELKAHPYFKFRLSNAIISYRIQHGNYKKLEELKNIVIVDDSIYRLVSPYLKIE